MKKIKKILPSIKSTTAVICTFVHSRFRAILLLMATITLFGCNEHPVKSIEFTQSSLLMSVGDKVQIEAKMLPLDAQIYNRIIWSSSDNSVAQVNERGEVTAVYSGTCVITARAGNVKAHCDVTVKQINLIGLNFTNAVANFCGDLYNAGVNVCQLRFYSDGYDISPDGNVFGAGYYFNAAINIPLTDSLPSNGVYQQSATPISGSFLVGSIYEENGLYYADGTYFGMSSLGGNSVILIKNGTFNVQGNHFSGTFVGEKEETVQIDYTGDILLIDNTLPRDTLDFDFENATVSVENLGDIYGYGTAVFCVKIVAENQSLRVEFFAPLSASNIPTGLYRLNGSHSAFSLAESDIANMSGTLLIENLQPKAILFGNALISQEGEKKFLEIYFVDEQRRMTEGKIEITN
ncbi:MAG: Ig-like domain-containing protein [Prevotellaceae bacterium]|jgi:hypothetical protein|nr:Ig-like domain-containing protein [Prevotellaceae bacterium]